MTGAHFILQGEEFKEEVSLLKTKLVELEQKYQTMLTVSFLFT